MLLARDACGAHLGHPICSSPIDISLTRVKDVAGSGLVGLMTAECTSEQASGNFGKRFMTHQSWRTCGTPGPHTEVKVEGGKEWWPGAWPLLGSQVGCSVFCRFTLYWQIESIRVGTGVQAERSGSFEGSVIWVTQGLLKRDLPGWPAPHRVV